MVVIKVVIAACLCSACGRLASCLQVGCYASLVVNLALLILMANGMTKKP